MKNRYSYVVVGLIMNQGDTHISVSEPYALQPTRTKAKQELMNILEETRVDSIENDYEFDYTMEEDQLIIDVGDNHEIWAIHKVKRN